MTWTEKPPRQSVSKGWALAQREVSVNRKDEDKSDQHQHLGVRDRYSFARIPAAQDQVIQDRLILQDLRSTLTALLRLASPQNRTPSPSGYGAKHLSFSSRLISIRTGAPAARALALGFQDPMKGAAAPTTPAAPTAAVEPAKTSAASISTVVSHFN